MARRCRAGASATRMFMRSPLTIISPAASMPGHCRARARTLLVLNSRRPQLKSLMAVC